MEIVKVINNNIVSALDDENREIILMGRGLGLGKAREEDSGGED